MWRMLETDLSAGEKLLLLTDFDRVLGLRLDSGGARVEIPAKIKHLLSQREQLRREKKWSQADQLRQEIEAAGFEIQDTPEGTKIWSKVAVDESRN